MTTLDTYLTTLPGRCPTCGYAPKFQGHAPDCGVPAANKADGQDEWAIFVAALRAAAVDGKIRQRNVRPLIRGRIEPKHIGLLYRRARRERLLVEVDRERSNDEAGRNTHHLEPVYELRGAS